MMEISLNGWYTTGGTGAQPPFFLERDYSLRFWGTDIAKKGFTRCPRTLLSTQSRRSLLPHLATSAICMKSYLDKKITINTSHCQTTAHLGSTHTHQHLICLPIIHQAVVKQHVHSCPGCAILGQVFKVPEQWMGTRQNITVKVVKQAACNNSNWDFCLHQDWGVPTLPWHMLRQFNLIHSYGFPRKWYGWFLGLLLT